MLLLSSSVRFLLSIFVFPSYSLSPMTNWHKKGRTDGGEIEGGALGETEATAADDHQHQSKFEEGRRKGTDGRRRNRRRGGQLRWPKGRINGQKGGEDTKKTDRQR
ncbi:hypothetical protein niasHT_016669 [Heterodera trifolii]|uniref:Secreted protein n=1 Tax=Heterodera trifolii TaxID=157864 RepID=A0ABD2KUC3_9BILA